METPSGVENAILPAMPEGTPTEDLAGDDGVIERRAWRPLRLEGPISCLGDSTLSGRRKVTFLSRSGYFEHWLVTLKDDMPDSESLTEAKANEPITRYLLRLPSDDCLLPAQLTNEVAYLRFIPSRLPHIRVPKVYTYAATTSAETSFIIMEYLPWPRLCDVWMSYTLDQKENVASQLASIFLDFAGTRFPLIGGLDPDSLLCAPTVEGCKSFKGRKRFHRPECYNIGPYKSIEEYLLAYYDKEIQYYSNGSLDEFQYRDLIDDERKRKNWIAQLKIKRQKLESWKTAKEPFVLDQGDFRGQNILMKDGVVAAVLNWGFAGSYPLSEVSDETYIEVLKITLDSSEEDENENDYWVRKIRRLIFKGAKDRGWEGDDLKLLMGGGNPVVSHVRIEMFPNKPSELALMETESELE
ncbi:hypothetical protein B7494_g932 [Chlorociboria aeruginascens]|nr:hypothetical protein B7494_g932 [Chlorociboria aeruginascens]